MANDGLTAMSYPHRMARRSGHAADKCRAEPNNNARRTLVLVSSELAMHAVLKLDARCVEPCQSTACVETWDPADPEGHTQALRQQASQGSAHPNLSSRVAPNWGGGDIKGTLGDTRGLIAGGSCGDIGGVLGGSWGDLGVWGSYWGDPMRHWRIASSHHQS